MPTPPDQVHTIGYLTITGPGREAVAGHVILHAAREGSRGRRPVTVDVLSDLGDDVVALELTRPFGSGWSASEIDDWVPIAEAIVQRTGQSAEVTATPGLLGLDGRAFACALRVVADHADVYIACRGDAHGLTEAGAVNQFRRMADVVDRWGALPHVTSGGAAYIRRN